MHGAEYLPEQVSPPAWSHTCSSSHSDSVPRAYPCSLPDRQAHAPVTATPCVRSSPPLASHQPRLGRAFNPLWHPGFPFRRSLRHRPPRRPCRRAFDRKTFASAVSHPHCASAHTTRVAVLADGLLPPGRNPHRRRRRRHRCHRSCRRFCRHRGHSGEQCWHGHSPLCAVHARRALWPSRPLYARPATWCTRPCCCTAAPPTLPTRARAG